MYGQRFGNSKAKSTISSLFDLDDFDKRTSVRRQNSTLITSANVYLKFPTKVPVFLSHLEDEKDAVKVRAPAKMISIAIMDADHMLQSDFKARNYIINSFSKHTASDTETFFDSPLSRENTPVSGERRGMAKVMVLAVVMKNLYLSSGKDMELCKEMTEFYIDFIENMHLIHNVKVSSADIDQETSKIQRENSFRPPPPLPGRNSSRLSSSGSRISANKPPRISGVESLHTDPSAGSKVSTRRSSRISLHTDPSAGSKVSTRRSSRISLHTDPSAGSKVSTRRFSRISGVESVHSDNSYATAASTNRPGSVISVASTRVSDASDVSGASRLSKASSKASETEYTYDISGYFDGIDVDLYKGMVAGNSKHINRSKDEESITSGISAISARRKRSEERRQSAKKRHDAKLSQENKIKSLVNQAVGSAGNPDNFRKQREEMERRQRRIELDGFIAAMAMFREAHADLKASIPNESEIVSHEEIDEEFMTTLKEKYEYMISILESIKSNYPNQYNTTDTNEKLKNMIANVKGSIRLIKDKRNQLFKIFQIQESVRIRAEEQRLKREEQQLKREADNALKCEQARKVLSEIELIADGAPSLTGEDMEELERNYEFYKLAHKEFSSNVAKCSQEDMAMFTESYTRALKKTKDTLDVIRAKHQADLAKALQYKIEQEEAEKKRLAKQAADRKKREAEMKEQSKKNAKEAIEYAQKIRKVIAEIEKSGKTLKKINPTFHLLTTYKDRNLLFGKPRMVFYHESESSISDQIIGAGSSPEELYELSLTFKQDYEILRGPVRVYVKTKPKTSNENSKNLVKKSGEYKVEFENRKVGPFSRVYEGTDTASKIYKDSIKETISGMVGNADHVIMAYGPSGSGKTYNLIGEGKSVKGVISYCIDDLVKKGKVEMVSYQLYNACRNGMVTSTKFDSFAHNCDFSKEKSRMKKDDYTPCPTHPFKYRQGTEHVIGNKEMVKIAEMCYGASALHEIDERSYTGAVPMFNGKKVVSGGKISIRDRAGKKLKTLKGGSVDETIRNTIKNMYASLDREEGVVVTPKINVHGNDDSLIVILKPSGYGAGAVHKLKDGLFLRDNMELRRVFNLFTDIVPSDSSAVIIDGKKESLSSYKDKRISEVAKSGEIDKVFSILLGKFINFSSLFDTKFNFVPERSDDEFISTEIKSSQEFSKYYALANASRPSRGTPLNPDSSRSHLFFEFMITPNVDNALPTTLTFVDLAGNEKADENLFLMRAEGDGVVASLHAVRSILERKQAGKNLGDEVGDVPDSIFSNVVSTNKAKCRQTAQMAYNNLTPTFVKPTTTVSMLLNLPGYGFENKDSNTNRREAISGGLEMMDVLMERNLISQYLDSAKN